MISYINPQAPEKKKAAIIILFVLFMLTVCILGAVVLLEMSYEVAAIIGGVAAMVMVIGLIMSPQKNEKGKGGS